MNYSRFKSIEEIRYSLGNYEKWAILACGA
jgi:hypothetical protein